MLHLLSRFMVDGAVKPEIHSLMLLGGWPYDQAFPCSRLAMK